MGNLLNLTNKKIFIILNWVIFEFDLYQTFEENFRKEMKRIGFNVIDVMTSRDVKNPTVSFEIVHNDSGRRYEQKDIKIREAFGGQGGWGRDRMIFLRLDISFPREN